jgi:hypothetical protein
MFVDMYPLGVTKVKEFDAAGGRGMFCNVDDHVRDSHQATMPCCMEVCILMGRHVAAAGCTLVFVLLAPERW